MSVHIKSAVAGPRAFTLMEMLLVIALIVVLVSLLLPALSEVQAYTRRMLCQANQRAINQGVMNYANDHAGTLVPLRINPGMPGYPDGEFFSNILVREGYVDAPNGLVSRSPFRCPENVLEQNINYHGWVPLGDSAHTTPKHFMYTYPIAADPTGDDPQPIDGVAIPSWYHLAGGNHQNWTFRWMGNNPNDWNLLRKLSQVTDAGNRVVSAEQSNINASSPNYGQSRIAARHKPFTNDGNDGLSIFSFFDGSVRPVETANWYAGMDVSPIRYLYVD